MQNVDEQCVKKVFVYKLCAECRYFISAKESTKYFGVLRMFMHRLNDTFLFVNT